MRRSPLPSTVANRRRRRASRDPRRVVQHAIRMYVPRKAQLNRQSLGAVTFALFIACLVLVHRACQPRASSPVRDFRTSHSPAAQASNIHVTSKHSQYRHQAVSSGNAGHPARENRRLVLAVDGNRASMTSKPPLPEHHAPNHQYPHLGLNAQGQARHRRDHGGNRVPELGQHIGNRKNEPHNYKTGRAVAHGNPKMQRTSSHSTQRRTTETRARPVDTTQLPTTTKIVMFEITKYNGLGSQVLRLIDALAVADRMGRELHIQPFRYWNYGCGPWRGWECYFVPPHVRPHTLSINVAISSPTDCSELEDITKNDPTCIAIATRSSATRAAATMLLECQEANTGREGRPNSHLKGHQSMQHGQKEKQHAIHALPGRAECNKLLAWASAEQRRYHKHTHDSMTSTSLPKNKDTLPHARDLAARLFRLTPSTRGRILAQLSVAGLDLDIDKNGKKATRPNGEASQQAFNTSRRKPYVGVHIRRGDKHKETKDVPIEAYVHAVDLVSPAGAPVFVATDDGKALLAMRQAMEKLGRAVIALQSTPSRRGHIQSQANSMPLNMNRPRVEALLAEIHALARADWFVGTFSSNLGRLVHVLRREHASETSISLDDRWAPGVAYRTFGMPYCDSDDANKVYCAFKRRGPHSSRHGNRHSHLHRHRHGHYHREKDKH